MQCLDCEQAWAAWPIQWWLYWAQSCRLAQMSTPSAKP